MFEIIRSFDKSADTYEDWYREPLGEYALRAELKGLNALLPERGLGAEIGAGTGILAMYLTTRSRTILCVDPAAKMLSKAHGRGLQAVIGTAELPPIKPHSLDFIYLVIVIEFLYEPMKALSSLRHLLKPRSPIIIVIINKESPWGDAYAEAGRRGDPIFRHAHFYTLENVVSFIEQADYKFDRVIGTLPDPPDTIPNGEPQLLSLATPRRSDVGVFLIRGIKA